MLDFGKYELKKVMAIDIYGDVVTIENVDNIKIDEEENRININGVFEGHKEEVHFIKSMIKKIEIVF